MLRSSLFNDPFFNDGNDHLRQVDRMFDDSFGMMARRDRPALPERRHRDGNRQVAQRGMSMDPFSHFENMFSNMHSMMSDMRHAFADGEQLGGEGRGNVYQHSSFTSYSNTGGGNPKVYQTSSSSRQGPNGVRETRKTLRDSERGIDKMAVGHHIQDRGHVIERSRNNCTGDMDENKQYINLDEEEAPSFEQEYNDRWQSAMRGIDQRRHVERSKHSHVASGSRHHAALPGSEVRRPRKVTYRKE